jgi:hypothetical protein
MMMEPVKLVLNGALLALLYAFISNRLMRWGGAHRTIVIELGAHLLEDPKVSEDIKRNVKLTLRLATSTHAAWGFALCVIPATISVLLNVPKSQWKERRIPPKGLNYRPHSWDAWTAYTQALTIAILCNSPAAFLLYYVQMAIVSMIVWPHIIMMRLIRQAIEKVNLHQDDAHEQMALKI